MIRLYIEIIIDYIYFFIIGIFINEVQKDKIKEYENIMIHEDDNAYVTNDFINIALANTYVEFCKC